jgi:hypothetical protein
MRGIAELLSNILFILIPLVPVLLLFLARRTVIRRRKSAPPVPVEEYVEEQEPTEKLFPAARDYPASEGRTYRRGRTADTRSTRRPAPAETQAQEQSPAPLQQISRYPELQKAVIYREILGPPKSLSGG